MPKRARKRPEQQVETCRVSTAAIMSSREFEKGFSDARKGIAFDWRNDSWEYERGRAFAFIAPLSMSLRVGGKLNPKAVALCEAAFNRRLMV